MRTQIDSAERLQVRDAELSKLLWDVFVGEGFTAPEIAEEILNASAVRRRGRLLCARDLDTELLAGMVIVVFPDSPARRLAAEDEAEMHLLAVQSGYRKHGLGRALIAAAMRVATDQGFRRMVLWTQPQMHAAQHLYYSVGFRRSLHRHLKIGDRQFLVFERPLESQCES